MTFADKLDEEKLAEAALAILSLTAAKEMGAVRAWKGMDWDLLDVLYQKGWILDPVEKLRHPHLINCPTRLRALSLFRTSISFSLFRTPISF
jgi:hypothetical protein